MKRVGLLSAMVWVCPTCEVLHPVVPEHMKLAGEPIRLSFLATTPSHDDTLDDGTEVHRLEAVFRMTAVAPPKVRCDQCGEWFLTDIVGKNVEDEISD